MSNPHSLKPWLHNWSNKRRHFLTNKRKRSVFKLPISTKTTLICVLKHNSWPKKKLDDKECFSINLRDIFQSIKEKLPKAYIKSKRNLKLRWEFHNECRHTIIVLKSTLNKLANEYQMNILRLTNNASNLAST